MIWHRLRVAGWLTVAGLALFQVCWPLQMAVVTVLLVDALVQFGRTVDRTLR